MPIWVADLGWLESSVSSVSVPSTRRPIGRSQILPSETLAISNDMLAQSNDIVQNITIAAAKTLL